MRTKETYPAGNSLSKRRDESSKLRRSPKQSQYLEAKVSILNCVLEIYDPEKEYYLYIAGHYYSEH